MRIPIRYVALICVLILTPLFVRLTVYRPANQAVEDVAHEIRTRTQRLTNFSVINSQYRQMQAAIGDIEIATAAAKQKLPAGHQAEQWLGEASTAAQLSGLVVRSVTIASNRGSGEYGVLPVNMEVHGSFSGVYELIQRFERMDRLIPMRRLDIHRVDDTTVDATMVLHLVFDGVDTP